MKRLYRTLMHIVILTITLSLIVTQVAGLQYTEYENINEYIDYYENQNISFFDEVENTASFISETLYQTIYFTFSDSDYSDFVKGKSGIYVTQEKKLFGCDTTLMLTPVSATDTESNYYLKSDISIILNAEDEEQNYTILSSMAQVMRALELNDGLSIIVLNEKLVTASELVSYLKAEGNVEKLTYTLSVEKFTITLFTFGDAISFGCTFDFAT